MFGYVGHCVTRAVKSAGHALWLGFQTDGYIMATGMLPPEETDDLVNPEFQARDDEKKREESVSFAS